MESINYVNHNLFPKKIHVSGHEMLIFQSEISWQSIKEWIFDQISHERKIFVYDDLSSIESMISSNEKDLIKSKPVKLFSLQQKINTMQSLGFQRIRDNFRGQIWKAIIGGLSGVSFLFNFTEMIKKNLTSVMKFERIIKEISDKSWGFPIDCCCIYDSTLEMIDFTELTKLHTNYQFFNEEKNKKETKFLHSEPIHHIAQRSFSENISPFYFRKRNEVIGIAYDLESFYENLANIPLEVFCFHCYRVTNYDLAGVTGKINPRSDITLWIEFSIGDTELAQQIYNVCQQSLGTSTSLDRRSKFDQTTIRSSILRLIAERIIFLKSIGSADRN